MSSPLRIALIGAGNMGQQHYRHLQSLTEATLCAVADPGPQAVGLAAEWGVAYFADHRQMLEQVKPDAVIVANPNTLHVSTALDCLAVGVPVLLEKPVGVHLNEVRELVGASKATGVPVLVGHHRRHNPLIVRAYELVHSGALGSLTGSDAVAAPWSWELDCGENPVYPRQADQPCYLLAGTGGALSIPQLKRWHYADTDGGWHQPLLTVQENFSADEALRLQLQHFVRVARREVEPLVSVADAARTLALIEAIREAAETGRACAPTLIEE
ncbi:Gfo/Idh/MocA family protein [Pseudomonas silensiensis]|uniref:Gfo/Idh/MocA family protein n=1 Tax=Pseudomonas silensiensis TaxID=2991049 RepID=UPI003D1B2235